MPNDTTQQTKEQATTPQSSSDSHGVNPEKMLVEMLKELEQQIADLSQRVDVLESGQNPEAVE